MSTHTEEETITPSLLRINRYNKQKTINNEPESPKVSAAEKSNTSLKPNEKKRCRSGH